MMFFIFLFGLILAYVKNIPLADMIKFELFLLVFSNIGFIVGIYLIKKDNNGQENRNK